MSAGKRPRSAARVRPYVLPRATVTEATLLAALDGLQLLRAKSIPTGGAR